VIDETVIFSSNYEGSLQSIGEYSLLQHHHLPCLDEIACLQAVEIDAT